MEDPVTMAVNENAATRATGETGAADPRDDGRTRCTWVQGRPEHHAFHDAEFGMIPDDEALAQERLLLVCLQRDLPLADVLDHRDAVHAAFQSWDLAQVAALDDAALDAISARGGPFADRKRLAWIRDVAAAGAETAKAAKGLREYFLAVRFLDPEAQIADMTQRFPGFGRLDAAHLMEILGLVAGSSHERDCWRA